MKGVVGVSWLRVSLICLWMMPLAVLAGAFLYSSGYANAGVVCFVVGAGCFAVQWVADFHNPLLYPPQSGPKEPITAINGLPLPAELLALVDEGRWKRPADRSGVDQMFPAEPEGVRLELALYTLDYMPFENRSWMNVQNPTFLGAPDDTHQPGDIDPKRSVLIGDLGLGLDQPIALDYRVEQPRVLTLDYSRGPRSRWVEVAPNIQSFAERIGL